MIDDLQAGTAGEYLVCADLIIQGFVAFPSEQGLPFDVVVDVDGRLIKVQVKTTRGMRPVLQRKSHVPSYVFHIKRTGKRKSKTYKTTDVDLFALVALESREIGYFTAAESSRSMVFRVSSFRGSYFGETPNEITSQIRELRSSGASWAEIALQVGMHRANVRRSFENKCYFACGRYLPDFPFEAALVRHGLRDGISQRIVG
jgi:hypothetical protein